jgi:hypothetical protein
MKLADSLNNEEDIQVINKIKKKIESINIIIQSITNYIKEQEELEEKENDEMKYYEIHYDYDYNVNYYEDLYLTYNNKYK